MLLYMCVSLREEKKGKSKAVLTSASRYPAGKTNKNYMNDFASSQPLCHSMNQTSHQKQSMGLSM